tara:strand:+ start:2828 stop:3835 length:1008 start_codon:yes stop_codon:yes gene_type:complete
VIISKTPYRISFFGGGSDYPEWYLKNGGTVISSTINKYIYISCRELPPFFRHKHRIVYSKIELIKKISDIKHSVVKEALEKIFNNYTQKGLEIHYDGDLPSRSGIGSSSSFVVGLLNALNRFHNIKISKDYLAKQSLFLEQSILKETVGSQDQIAASYGGFNEIIFKKDGKFKVNPLINKKSVLKKLEDSLVLVFTGVRKQSETANHVASTYVSKLSKSKKKNILKVIDHVKLAKKYLKNEKFDDFGALLNETWIAKRELSKVVTNNKLDAVYKLGLKNGALGGKLLGAGGAGFFLFYIEESKKEFFLKAFEKFTCIPFKFEQEGSSIIFNDKRN